jgi:predicted lipid-binding transport protein (Tim44 family)
MTETAKTSRFRRGPVTKRSLTIHVIGGLVGGAVMGWLWGQLIAGLAVGFACGVGFALLVGDETANDKTGKDQAGPDQETS